ncbi:MAG: hypothetical protein WD275_00140 [Rhodothermales bacterium]
MPNIHVDLTDDELETLVGVLKSYLSDLRMEISGTDSQDFRDILKERKRVLEKVVTELGGRWRMQKRPNP